MTDPLKRDTLLTMTGMALLATAFLLGIYLPGRKASARLQMEIQTARQSVASIPQRVAELQQLREALKQRQDYLQATSGRIPESDQMHEVLGYVARLADRSRLSVSHIKPLPPVTHQTYSERIFELEFSGEFASVARFLQGLEDQPRLVAVREVSFESGGEGVGGRLSGSLRFAVFVRVVENANSDGNANSSGARDADIGSS